MGEHGRHLVQKKLNYEAQFAPVMEYLETTAIASQNRLDSPQKSITSTPTLTL